LEDSKLIPN